MLKLKRFEWPMARLDASRQMGYLRRLPKYRVLVVPAAPEPERQPLEEYYLRGAEIASDVGRDELPLRIECAAYPEEFRFDEANGWLFHDGADEYDYMYCAHVGSQTAPPVGDRFPLSWKRSRMLMEKKPYRFVGAFQAEEQDGEKFLRWKFCTEGGSARWNTRDILHVGDFTLDQDAQLSVEGPRGFLLGRDDHDYGHSMGTPWPNGGVIYRLKLIPVVTER